MCEFRLCHQYPANQSYLSTSKTPPNNDKKLSLLESIILRGAAPFILQYALSRGLLHMIQASIGFLFMLAIMCVTI
jgi:hypothetical protein